MFKLIFLVFGLTGLISCGGGSGSGGGGGGGGSGGDGGGGGSPPISSAATFEAYLDLLDEYRNNGLGTPTESEISSFRSYNLSYADLSGVPKSSIVRRVVKNQSIVNPIHGKYESFIQPTVPTSPRWPEPNGRLLFKAESPTSGSVDILDLTNNLQVDDGDTKNFSAMKNPELTSLGLTGIPILILVEGIATLDGIPQYRYLNVSEGHLYEANIPNGPEFDGSTGSLFSGYFRQYALEVFVEGGTFTQQIDGVITNPAVSDGLVSAYDIYYVRKGTNNWSSTLNEIPEANANVTKPEDQDIDFDSEGNAIAIWASGNSGVSASKYIKKHWLG